MRPFALIPPKTAALPKVRTLVAKIEPNRTPTGKLRGEGFESNEKIATLLPPLPLRERCVALSLNPPTRKEGLAERGRQLERFCRLASGTADVEAFPGLGIGLKLNQTKSRQIQTAKQRRRGARNHAIRRFVRLWKDVAHGFRVLLSAVCFGVKALSRMAPFCLLMDDRFNGGTANK